MTTVALHTATMNSPLLQAYNRLPISMVRGEGVYLYDDKENSYLDFASGVAVTNLGHCHPYLVPALQQQIEQLWHCSNLFTIPQQNQLASRLVELTFADKVFFCSSGVEAVECAIKMMRKYHTNRHKIITLQRGFHGRSLAALSAGGNEVARKGFEPLLDGFIAIEPDNYEMLQQYMQDDIAGILLEPVQAEGGVYSLDINFLKEVRKLADKHNIILAFDEVQCGSGRTGSLFHYQQIDIEPDILTCGKGIGNGFPLAACLSKDHIAACITPGTHGSTYGGNPLAMSVGNAVLDVMCETGFFEHVKEIGNYLKTQLQKLQQTYPTIIKEVRGEGLLLGVELSISAKQVLLSCIKNGLAITKTAGDTTLRIVPPLIITKDQVDEAIHILSKALADN